MRDPHRIDRIISKLRALWHACPDLRLGQIVVNATPPRRDTFHVEDDELERYLDGMTARAGQYVHAPEETKR